MQRRNTAERGSSSSSNRSSVVVVVRRRSLPAAAGWRGRRGGLARTLMTMLMMIIVGTITGHPARSVRHDFERPHSARALNGPAIELAMAAWLASAGTPTVIVISISVIVAARPSAGHHRPQRALALLRGGVLTRRQAREGGRASALGGGSRVKPRQLGNHLLPTSERM